MAYPKDKNENYQNVGGINQKNSEYTTGQNEVLDLTNLSFERPGAWTSRDGTTAFIAATVIGRVSGLYEFTKLSGASYQIMTANTNAYIRNGAAWTPIRTGLLDSALFDFVTFVDHLFAANGQDFFKYDGTNSFFYGLPVGPRPPFGVTALVSGTPLPDGDYLAAYGYLNERGFFGPLTEGVSITLSGGNQTIRFFGMTTPAGYGITAIALYRTEPGGVDLSLARLLPFSSVSGDIISVTLGIAAPQIDAFTLVPRYLEIYQNRLFMAGFSSMPSAVYFSELGEPEGVAADSFFEVRTNDGDRVTALKAYQNSLMVFKERSFSRLTGDNPDNFFLAELSDQYGCVSNRATAVYRDTLLFLDTSGIVSFNGANIAVMSERVEPIFDAMNINAARDNAVAIHNRDRHEVWFAIPCNGATINNCIIVYNYLVDSFTKYEGVNPSSLTYMRADLTSNAPFVGSYTGSVSYFHADIHSDLGLGITYMFKSRFFIQGQNTVTEMWRRLYLDVDPVAGQSNNIECRFFTDHSPSASLVRTMSQSPFQSRIDFGLPAKSIAVQAFVVGTTTTLKINGYTFESRYQRNT